MQSTTHYVTILPGLEPIACDEINKRYGVNINNIFRAKSNSFLCFDFAGDMKDNNILDLNISICNAGGQALRVGA